ncbi:MAG: hypothetical protein ACP5JW_01750 [Candidatus Bathyarchaeia archaeon]
MSENLTSARYSSGGYLLSRRDGLICDGCGENFEKPILATIVSGGYSRTYYACPRCLTKVRDVKTTKHEKGMEEEKVPTVVVRKSGKSTSGDVKCEHFFGYLKKRPKNTPIPDECLTCNRMIECLTH